MVKVGVGRHIYCVALNQILSAVQWSIYAQIVNIIGIGLVKISVCLCVLRVIDKVGMILSRFLWVVIAFVSASHLAQVSETNSSSPSLRLLKSRRSFSFSYNADLWPPSGISRQKGNAFRLMLHILRAILDLDSMLSPTLCAQASLSS